MEALIPIAAVVGVICGWILCAILSSGKRSDLEFMLRVEHNNKEHWKKRCLKLENESLIEELKKE